MEKQLIPEPIGEGDLSSHWIRFKREFTQFLTATEKGSASEQVKLAIFLRTVGPRVNDLYETMPFAEGEDRAKWSVVCGKLDSWCARRTSKHVRRDKFFQMKQEGNSVDQFVTEIRKQVKDCEFGDLRDDLMLHVLIRGVESERMRRRLFETENLDLEKAIRMCQAMEATAADMQSLGVKTELGEKVAAIDSRNRKGKGGSAGSGKREPQKEGAQSHGQVCETGGETGGTRCSRCGLSHPPRRCPAYGQQCKRCLAYNHFARMCKKRGTVHLVEESPNLTDSGEEVLLITVKKVGKKLLAKVPFRRRDSSCDLEIDCQLDTAASCNVLTMADYEKLGCPPVETSGTNLTMYDGSVKKSLGRYRTQVLNRQGRPTDLAFELLETKHHTLLSLDSCLGLQLLSYESESVCLAEASQGLTKDAILSSYQDVFRGTGCLPGEYEIELEEGVPAVQNRPRRIPHVMKKAVESKLAEMEEEGWIAKVDGPSEWISNLTAVWKADKAQVRICLDPRDLNKAIKRSHFNMPVLEDVLPALKEARVFSLLDVKDGFMHVKLSNRSSFLTTFWGPKGRYRWLRMPFGISSAPEEFQRRLQAALHGIEGVAVVADDVLVFGGGKTDEEARQRHDEALVQLLMRARKTNIKFNKEKMRLHKSELQYIGHRISSKGVSPDPAKVKAIQQMAAPKSVTDVRRFLGMCNYLAKFIPNLSATSEPLRRLTEKDSEFQWGLEEQAAFERLKDMICKDQILAFYDVSKPVVIQCDASTEGLGATLLQGGRPVASVSRSLTKAEKNYVALELECLAIAFACSKFDQYIYGKKVKVETDHKPLEVITKKSILAAPRRLQRMLLALQRYDIEVVYRPGEQQVIADVLSRLPTTESPAVEDEDLTLQGIMAIHVCGDDYSSELEAVEERDFVRVKDERLMEVKRAAVTDSEQMALSQVIKQGWPAHWRELPEAVRKYWNFRELLVVRDGVIFKGDQVVVPEGLRENYLQKLHASHMGSESTLRRARDAVYWPGMAEDIYRVTKQCPICEEDSPAQPRGKLLAHDIPKQPWSKVGMDLFKCKGKEFLIMVDYLTDFFEVSELPNTLASTVVEATKRNFARHGIPLVVHTDGGPQFMSHEFRSFAKAWEFQQTVSSPYNSQSNGKAESAVKIAKRLFKRSRDPYLALLEWRNTPTAGLDTSPSQRLFARRTRGAITSSEAKLAAKLPQGTWEKKVHKQAQIQLYRSGKGSTFAPLRKGEPVLVQDLRARKTQWMRGKCEGQLSKNSYTVEVDGQLLHRNRQFVKPSWNSPPLDLGCPEPELDQLPDQSKDIPKDRELPSPVGPVPSMAVPNAVPKLKKPGPSSVPKVPKQKAPPDQEPPTGVPEPRVTTTRSGRISKKPERFVEQC